MPKMKTKSGAKKRFRFTGSGKIRRSRAYHRHNFSHKSSKQSQRLRQMALVHPSNESQVRRMLLG